MSEETVRELQELLADCEFAPQDGLSARVGRVSVAAEASELAGSGVGHLRLRLVPDGDYPGLAELRLRLTQSGAEKDNMVREARTDTQGVALFKWVLMDAKCRVMLLDLPVPVTVPRRRTGEPIHVDVEPGRRKAVLLEGVSPRGALVQGRTRVLPSCRGRHPGSADYLVQDPGAYIYYLPPPVSARADTPAPTLEPVLSGSFSPATQPGAPEPEAWTYQSSDWPLTGKLEADPQDGKGIVSVFAQDPTLLGRRIRVRFPGAAEVQVRLETDPITGRAQGSRKLDQPFAELEALIPELEPVEEAGGAPGTAAAP
jgi:hypothetical protein